jgi:hypothetical protein
MIASAVTLAAVLGFAVSMLVDSDFGSFVSSILIALGFVPMIGAYTAFSGRETKAAGYAALAFSAVYAVFVLTVYFTQLTAVRLSDLSPEAAALLDYSKFGLMFSLDLLGYAMMALATFFVGLTIKPATKADKWLKALLMIHGIFAVTCLVMPMLGLFKPGMAGGDLVGVLVLEFWCAYFTPVCILSYLHFWKRRNASL